MSEVKRRPPTAAELGITDVRWVLSEIYQLKISIIKGNEAYFLCVAHNDHHPSASVNLQTGWWSCWTCGAGGDIINLGTYIFQVRRMRVEMMLTPTDSESRRASITRSCESLRSRLTMIEQREKEGFIDRIQSEDEFEDGPLTYMYGRGFTTETLRTFNIRFGRSFEVRTKAGRKMKMQNTVCIPIYDEDDEIVSWCFRATLDSHTWQPRYLYTTGVSLTPHLYAYNYVKRVRSKRVVVTEGPLDAMWIWQAGYPSVAVFGTGNATAPEKIEKLSDFERVTIFGDRDEAGVRLVQRLGNLLSRHTSVRVVRYRRSWEGNDPNTLTAWQVEDAIERAISYHEWRIIQG